MALPGGLSSVAELDDSVNKLAVRNHAIRGRIRIWADVWHGDIMAFIDARTEWAQDQNHVELVKLGVILNDEL